MRRRHDPSPRRTAAGPSRALALACALLAAAGTASAQEPFDACTVFTQAEAQLALGQGAEPEPQNPRVKRPRFVPTCSWWSSKDGKTVTATATFRFARSESDHRPAFDEERLNFQTRPYLVDGAPAFWSAKQGVIHVLKGRVWMVVSVGGPKPAERDAEAARALAEALAKKL